MSLDSVNRLSQMMEVLRRQMAESARRMETGESRTSKAGQPGSASAKSGIQELRARLHERLSALDPTDPRRSRKAKRLFLESVLAWEFGNELPLDRRFDDMLEDIQHTISASPELDARFDQLLNEIAAK